MMRRKLFKLGYGLVLLLLGACGESFQESVGPEVKDGPGTFPKLVGDWYVPLEEMDTYSYEYLFAEDTLYQSLQWQEVDLKISAIGVMGYSYHLQGETLAPIFKNLTFDEYDAGIYFVGVQKGDSTLLADSMYLWVPQFPKNYPKPWKLWNGNTMEVFATDTLIYLDQFNADYEVQGEDGSWGHRVLVMRETGPQTETFHFFKRRYGLIAQQRNFRGYFQARGEVVYILPSADFYWKY